MKTAVYLLLLNFCIQSNYVVYTYVFEYDIAHVVLLRPIMLQKKACYIESRTMQTLDSF